MIKINWARVFLVTALLFSLVGWGLSSVRAQVASGGYQGSDSGNSALEFRWAGLCGGVAWVGATKQAFADCALAYVASHYTASPPPWVIGTLNLGATNYPDLVVNPEIYYVPAGGGKITQGGGTAYLNARCVQFADTPGAWSQIDTPATLASKRLACAEVNTCEAKRGKDAGSPGYFSVGGDPGGQPQVAGCSGGCGTTFSGTGPFQVLGGGGSSYYYKGVYSFDGSKCSGGDSGPSSTPTLPPDTCPGGQVLSPGPPKSCVPDPDPPCPAGSERVGGVCVPKPCPPGSDRNNAGFCAPWPPCPPGTVRGTDGTSACVAGPPPPGGGGGGGGGGGNDPPPDKPPPEPGQGPDGTFCEKNPTDPMCAKSAFSKACNAPSSCTGDAVSCAIAIATTQLGCDFEPNAKAWDQLRTTVGPSYKSSDYASAMGLSYDLSTVLDTTDKDGAASCPEDIHYSAMGHEFTIPMSPFCTLAGYVKFFVLFAASIIAVRILFS